jgi:DNA-directed RNA polymerase subunit RPC12/RpoP
VLEAGFLPMFDLNANLATGSAIRFYLVLVKAVSITRKGNERLEKKGLLNHPMGRKPRRLKEPMNIIERGRAFVQGLREIAKRSVWSWGQCPHCGSRRTIKYGSYTRHPWTLKGRIVVQMPRHLYHECERTYSETSAWLV